MKTKYFIVLIVTLLLTATMSCRNSTNRYRYEHREFYDTGELWVQQILLNDSVFLHRQYFKNGNLWQTGYMLITNDSIGTPFGYWRLYFADGTLEWAGEFDREGNPIPPPAPWLDINPQTGNWDVNLQFEHSPVKGEVFNFRVPIPQLHPFFYFIVQPEPDFALIPRDEWTQSPFNHSIIPEERGWLRLIVSFLDREAAGVDYLTFWIEVE